MQWRGEVFTEDYQIEMQQKEEAFNSPERDLKQKRDLEFKYLEFEVTFKRAMEKVK